MAEEAQIELASEQNGKIPSVIQSVMEGQAGEQIVIKQLESNTNPEGGMIITNDESGNIVMQISEADNITDEAGQTIFATYNVNEMQAGENMVEFANAITELQAGEQLLQFANTAHEEQEKANILIHAESAGQEEGQIPSTVKDIQSEVQMVQIPSLDSKDNVAQIPSTVVEIQNTDGEEQIPVIIKEDENGQQIFEVIQPVSSGHGNSVQSVSVGTDSQLVTGTLQEIKMEEVASEIEGQQIVIDGMPAGYQNLRSEVLEDGTIQVYFVDDADNAPETMIQDTTSLEDGTFYIQETPASKVESGMQTSMMSIRAKQYRDVATQITCFPKFTRQGLFDVATQVSNKDITKSVLRFRGGKHLPNGTTVIQNSIKTQNESTVVLKAGDASQIIFHKCNICGKVYKNKLNWQNHIKVHSGEKVYMCGHCGKVYQRGSLASHLRTHSELRQIAVFENLPDDMKRKNHKSIPGLVFPNQEASIVELSIADVAMELDETLFPPPAAIPSPEPPPPPAPPLPSEVYTDNDIPAKMEVEAEAEIQEGTSKTKYIFKCNVCGKEYNNKSNCHRHLKTHTTDKTYKCGYCGKAFTHRYEVRMHCRIHTGERPFKCPICTRGFNESGNLRRHMKIHVGDDSPYKCGVCFKGFDNTVRLNAHMKVHTGDIVCDVCNRKFSKISDLYRHIKIHTGDRPYKCDYCDKTFCQKVNLVTHQRTHTGQKAFRCTLCGQGFSRKAILQQHIKSHEEEFDGDTGTVERSAVRGEKEQVEVMEAEVIEHMEEMKKSVHHQEVVVEDADDEDEEMDQVIVANRKK